MKKSPLEQVKAQFGGKAELVDQLLSRLEKPEGESDAEFRGRILAASNAKLLKLWRTSEAFSAQFGGSKDKLVDAVLKLERPTSKKVDTDHRAALARRSVGYLLDRHASLSKRAG